ncbi:MAG: hypothetical protein WBB86_04345 [Candidatus Omnitrophota bacterium]
MKTQFLKSVCKLVVLIMLFSGVGIVSDPGWADGPGEDVYWDFYVPVDLKDLHPKIKKIHILVIIFDKDDNQVGSGEVQKKVPPSGDLKKTINIKAKPTGELDPWSAAKYYAGMRLIDEDGKMSFADVYPQGEKGPPIQFKSRPGTELVREVDGKLGLIKIKKIPGALKGKK